MKPTAPNPNYDFRRCKYCGSFAAQPLYRLARQTIYRCSQCDFHALDRLDPIVPRSGHDEEKPLDERSRQYMERRMQDVDPLLPLRLQLVREQRPLAGARLLDIGAGTGQFMQRMSEEGVQARGLEPSDLRRQFAHLKFGLELEAETVETFGTQQEHQNAFDLVTLWDVIEHVNFPVETLEGARHCLKPGGYLFIDTPSRDALSYRLSEGAYRLSGGKVTLFLDSFYEPVPYGHKQIFRPQQLVDLVEKVGFRVIRQDSGFLPPGNWLQSLLRPRNRIVLICQRPAA
ncbi:class I SAM-dependent methyltransferase [Desulfuromonas sp. AOP6]|uniref:class I SAM-dependent methyltransferase n=1 Tax=Desulfuromonas sp. AOP6 TaxID=1566351 RepID=UPI001286E8CD|nr:class I SAM-dependent methyltransferase [Desulfuromonas sp. AOP6]BCA80834.1 hypothetical protein AOP6_2621 [Desulfuromonas sp. AOP6]